jgi:quercetin dioxygenase-like cupin family protein
MRRFSVRASAIFLSAALLPPLTAMAENVPDALSVEWQGHKPCEKLFEDAEVRVARCSFAPGAVHVCHSHPSYISYVLSGGKAQVQDEKGTREVELRTGSYVDVPSTPWHEVTNIGDTMLQFLIVEKKYQATSPVNHSVCPSRRP